jgi:hypothetical protein
MRRKYHSAIMPAVREQQMVGFVLVLLPSIHTGMYYERATTISL